MKEWTPHEDEGEIQVEWCLFNCDIRPDCSGFEWHHVVDEESKEKVKVKKCFLLLTAWDSDVYAK